MQWLNDRGKPRRSKEVKTMAARQKIVKLAQKIASSKKEFTQQDPEYYALECVVTYEHADVTLNMDVRVPISPAMLS